MRGRCEGPDTRPAPRPPAIPSPPFPWRRSTSWWTPGGSSPSALTAPLTPLTWAGLIVSSVLTIGFTFLFNRPSFALQLLMVGSVAALTVFILWLVHDLRLPFSGTAAVGPEAFDQILQRFQLPEPGCRIRPGTRLPSGSL